MITNKWFQKTAIKHYEIELLRRNEINSSLEKLYSILIPLIGAIFFLFYSTDLTKINITIIPTFGISITLILLQNIYVLRIYYMEKSNCKSFYTILFIILSLISLLLSLELQLFFKKMGVLLSSYQLLYVFMLSTFICISIIIVMVFKSITNFRYQYLWTPKGILEHSDKLEKYYNDNKLEPNILGDLQEANCKLCIEAIEINHISNNNKEVYISLIKREIYLLLLNMGLYFVISCIITIGGNNG